MCLLFVACCRHFDNVEVLKFPIGVVFGKFIFYSTIFNILSSLSLFISSTIVKAIVGIRARVTVCCYFRCADLGVFVLFVCVCVWLCAVLAVLCSSFVLHVAAGPPDA